MGLFTLKSAAKNPPKCNRGSQTSTRTQPHTESLKPTFKVVSHTVMLQKLSVSAKERKKEKRPQYKQTFQFFLLNLNTEMAKKERKNCKALL